jgi:hypothetical protein
MPNPGVGNRDEPVSGSHNPRVPIAGNSDDGGPFLTFDGELARGHLPFDAGVSVIRKDVVVRLAAVLQV